MIKKNNKQLIFQTFFMFFCLSLASQEIHTGYCGTEVPNNFFEIENSNKENFEYYLVEYYSKVQSKSSTAITNVPVKIHIVTDANGATNITESQILDEIDEANTFLANSFLEITVCEETNYIANNQLYNFDYDDMSILYQNNQSNIMNLYFVESINDNTIAGYTHFPQNSQYYDVIVMDNQATTNNISSTLIHEFGHHFVLLHTHGTSNVPGSTDEYVNGSNCATTGDRFCDTPADPLINSSNVSSVNCLYNGNATDALGQVYEPDTSNIMSYSPDVCTDFFSEEQYAYMYAGYHVFRGTYYECPSFNVDFDAEINESCDDYMTVNFTDTSVGATAWEWDVDGDDIVDYTDQNPSHVYTPGLYDIALKIYNGSESITKVFPQYINFTSNIYETSKVNLKLFIVDLNENTWEFKDSAGNILYEGGPYEQNGEHNHEFDVVQSECYTFTIYDTAGNGLDGYNWMVGNESYELTTEEGDLIYTNTNFGSEESKLISTEYLSLNQNSINSISIYPNPADNFIYIRYQNILPDSYKIFDLNGRLINSKIINNEDDLEINVGTFERGLYFISISSGENMDNLKFLVK
tara:strand:- start:79 stop:1821 length:1743 start_codon:yes stop_codon:yes gene_type:complete